MNFTLHQLGLLDAPPEAPYDNLTSLASQLMHVPVAHISIADRVGKRIFYKSQVGHEGELEANRMLPMNLTYCQHVALTKAPVIVYDAREHPLLRGTPALAAAGAPLAYLGMPIYALGDEVVGGLCMMQPNARDWSDADLANAAKIATCVSDLIKLRAAMMTSERLRSEQQQFTYAISHDLRSPANTLHMVLDEVAHEGDKLSEETRALVDEGLGTIRRMGEQVEDVLKYSRTVDVSSEPETVSLGPLVANVLEDLKSCITEARATIACEDLPVISGHRQQLRALFQNLITNALKFRNPDEDAVIFISSGVDQGTGQHQITVSDNGIGIAEKNQQDIFGLFKRLHLREEYPGSGVGLALCRRVAENHNGTISVKSDGQNGSAFTVNFPRQIP